MTDDPIQILGVVLGSLIAVSALLGAMVRLEQWVTPGPDESRTAPRRARRSTAARHARRRRGLARPGRAARADVGAAGADVGPDIGAAGPDLGPAGAEVGPTTSEIGSTRA